MDRLDRDILDLLRHNARLSYRALGAAVGLSANAAADRVRRLVAVGTIRAFVTVIDEPADVDARLDLVVDARLRPGVDATAFESALVALPGVVEALRLTGTWDYQLRVRLPGVAHVDGLIRRLRQELGAEQTQTRLVLRTASAGPRA